MPVSRVYVALSFVALLRDGSSFMGPALHGNHLSLPQSGGLRRAGCAQQAGSSNLGVACSRPSLPRKSRGDVSMLAKKRRRRRAGESAADPPPKTVAAAPEPKPTPPSVGSTPASAGEQARQAEAEWEGGEEGEEEDEDGNVGAVVMPPLPSELGLEAVMSAQELQGEDMMSPAAYQPKPDVADIEMVDGGMGGGSGGLMGEDARKKGSKYSFDLAIDLPMESESREGGKQTGLGSSTMSPDGVMPLPDLRELAKKNRNKDRLKQATEAKSATKVDRGNIGAFTKLLELDPEADSEEGLFTTESYDAFSSILGEGKPFVGIANSYLQSGHTVLLVLVLLCGFVELPGFPLTSLPYDVREFLKTGLLVVYVINAGISYLSYLEAKRVGQPAAFWAVKGFFLGGLSFNELSQIEPRKVKTNEGGSQRRR